MWPQAENVSWRSTACSEGIGSFGGEIGRAVWHDAAHDASSRTATTPSMGRSPDVRARAPIGRARPAPQDTHKLRVRFMPPAARLAVRLLVGRLAGGVLRGIVRPLIGVAGRWGGFALLRLPTGRRLLSTLLCHDLTPLVVLR